MTFRRVTAAEFFAALNKTAGDIMPTLADSPLWDNERGYISTWKDQRTRAVFGRSYGTRTRIYELAEEAAQPTEQQQAAHRAADPHCTCPDCMLDYQDQIRQP